MAARKAAAKARAKRFRTEHIPSTGKEPEMGLFGRSPHTADSTPEGECSQCWKHAYDKSIHRRLGLREDCPQCVDHMVNGCPGFNRR